MSEEQITGVESWYDELRNCPDCHSDVMHSELRRIGPGAFCRDIVCADECGFEGKEKLSLHRIDRNIEEDYQCL